MNDAPETNNDCDPVPDIPPSIHRHINLQSFFEIGGSLVAPMIWAYTKLQSETGIGVSVAEGAMFFLLFILGYVIPHAIFRHIIGAGCPNPDCQGKLFPRGRTSVIYVCGSCGSSFETGLSEGNGTQ